MTPISSHLRLSLMELARIMVERGRDLKMLKKKRRECQRHLDRIDAAISKITGTNRSLTGNGFGRRPRNAVSLVGAIEQVLGKASSPVPIAEIAARVQASGYRSNSANFRGLVNMTLVTNERFQSAARGLYVLTPSRAKRSRRRVQPAEAEAAK